MGGISNTITINYLPLLEITVNGSQTMYERAYKAVVFDAGAHHKGDGSVVVRLQVPLFKSPSGLPRII